MSFRIKIALLAAVVTGGIILLSCWLLWNVTYHFNLETIDKQADQIVQSNIGKAKGTAFWKRLDDSLAEFNQDPDGKRLFRLWVEPKGRKPYISTHWPQQIDPGVNLIESSVESETIRKLKTPIHEDSEISKVELIKHPSLNKLSRNELWRIGIYSSAYGNMAVAFNVDAFDARMNQLKRRFYMVGLGAFFLTLTGAWYVARRSLKPLDQLISKIESLTTQELDQRIEEIGLEKEFRRLVTVFNHMMIRLEKSFNQAKRFSADASHELKTPISRLKLELEKALNDSPPGSQEQKSFSSLLDEIRHMSNIVNSLTLLSNSDAGKLPLTIESIDLALILENVVEDWRLFEAEKIFNLEIEGPSIIRGDVSLIEQAIQNLISNAVIHGRNETPVNISLSLNKNNIVIAITNHGAPIEVQDKEKLFERFFRTKTSKNLRKHGVGLGLSLTKEIAKAHSGDVSLVRSDQDSTTFQIVFPFEPDNSNAPNASEIKR